MCPLGCGILSQDSGTRFCTLIFLLLALSGGYNLKTGAGSMIELMKFDMGGAAAAFGAAKAIASIQPPGVEVRTSLLP